MTTIRGRDWDNPLPPRVGDGRLLAGVCGGWAVALEIDVTLIRFAFLITSLAWGLGLVAYLALWLLMPPPDTRREPLLTESVRENAREMGHELAEATERLREAWHRGDARMPWPRPLDRRWMAIGLTFAGVIILLASFGLFSWLTPVRTLGLAMAAGGAAIALSMRAPR